MAEVASAEYLREESRECTEFIQYLEDIEADLLDLEFAAGQTEQLPVENETQENKGLETMMTYFMILEEELTVEKQKAQRLQKLNEEIEKDRFETEERNRELIKQKHALETENQQLRQKLWRLKDVFAKSADELWQLRRQNRMLHEILQRSTMGVRAESESCQTLSGCEGFQKQAHQKNSQPHLDSSDDKHLSSSVSEPNIQHLLHNDDENNSPCHIDRLSLFENFVTLKQALQKKGDVGNANTKHLEGPSNLLKHETEPLMEGESQPHKAATESEEIPSEPNIQHLLNNDGENNSPCHIDRLSLLQNFVTLKQARQKKGDVGNANTKNLEGPSKLLKHETEPLMEGESQPYKAAAESEEIPSEPNIQHLLHNDDDNNSPCHIDSLSLLQNFLTLKQARQKKGDVGNANAKHLEGPSNLLKHETETLMEGESQPHKAATEYEEIPIMPAPLPKDFLLTFGENYAEVEKKPREKEINKLGERNSNLSKVLQKLEIQHSELKSHHDRLSKMFIQRQDPVDHIRAEISRRSILARKARKGCNGKEEEALLKAVKSGCVWKVREAISVGADVNLSLMGKWTPLHIAAAFGHVDVCKELLDAGALKHARDRWGDTPLHWAAVNGHQEVAKALALRGADVSRRGRGNSTPGERALVAGHGNLAQWFTKKEQEQLKGSTD